MRPTWFACTGWTSLCCAVIGFFGWPTGCQWRVDHSLAVKSANCVIALQKWLHVDCSDCDVRSPSTRQQQKNLRKQFSTLPTSAEYLCANITAVAGCALSTLSTPFLHHQYRSYKACFRAVHILFICWRQRLTIVSQLHNIAIELHTTALDSTCREV